MRSWCPPDMKIDQKRTNVLFESTYKSAGGIDVRLICHLDFKGTRECPFEVNCRLERDMTMSLLSQLRTGKLTA